MTTCPTCNGVGHLGPATDSPQRDWGRACPDCNGTDLWNAEAKRRYEEYYGTSVVRYPSVTAKEDS